MLYRIVLEDLNLKQSPSRQAPDQSPSVDLRDQLVKIDEQTVEGEVWWQVEVASTRGAPPQRGFLLATDVTELPEASLRWPETIDRIAYLSILTTAAERYGTNREYLALVAQMQSGLRNLAPDTDTGARGPYRFTPLQWQALTGADSEPDRPPLSLTATDIDSPWLQALGAARLTARNSDALLAALQRIPTGRELYLAHVIGVAATIGLLETGAVTDGAAVLGQLESTLGDEEGARRKRMYADLLMDDDSPRSLAQLETEIVHRMHAASAPIAEDILALPESLRLRGDASAQTPPWFVIARAELDKGIREDPQGSNPQIEAYFATVGLDRHTDDKAWCAAFVSFCMATSGNERVVQSNLRSARARDWLDWGTAITDPTPGALCVTRPLVANSSGHVAFFVSQAGGKVKLLGGNQGDAVSEQDFDMADVVGYRWLHWDADDQQLDLDVPAGARPQRAFERLLSEFTPEQAAGLVGNFMQESGESLNPKAFNSAEGAIGIAQWRLDRRIALRAFAGRLNGVETDFDVQLEFVLKELNSSHANAKTRIKQTGNVDEAALAVRRFYEIADPAHDAKRISFARTIATRFPV
ncbi:MAG: TIGR02594 family protein [Gammaproteobacteria bacterium]|nr:TIGR02594 family protein [Gammaproteobacteria bacterium]